MSSCKWEKEGMRGKLPTDSEPTKIRKQANGTVESLNATAGTF